MTDKELQRYFKKNIAMHLNSVKSKSRMESTQDQEDYRVKYEQALENVKDLEDEQLDNQVKIFELERQKQEQAQEIADLKERLAQAQTQNL